MIIEIIRRRSRRIDHLPVAFGRGFVVFDPPTSRPTRGRNFIGSRAIVDRSIDHARHWSREQTRHDRRLRRRDTIRYITF